MSVIKRPRALVDLDEIAEYIGRSSPPSAMRFLTAFDDTAAALAPVPEMGALYETSLPHLQDLRVWPVRGFKKYLIFYRPLADGIEVVRVLYGARDIPTILEEDGV